MHHRAPVLLALVLLLAGCGSGPDPLKAEPVATTEVLIDDNVYLPIAIEVPVGSEVTWTWQGRANHNVVGEGFASELVPDGTFSHTFDEPGVVPYLCTIHSRMRGVVRVLEG